jgi:subfamily B ATP-binding cassette protein MsbA
MREYITRVLELVKPYRFRFVLGLVCGFLSGFLAFTLPVSITLAVDTVFPEAKAEREAKKDAEKKNATRDTLAATEIATNQASAQATTRSADSFPIPKPPGKIKQLLDAARSWFRPSGNPSTARTLLVISLIPAAMLVRGLLQYLNIYLLSWVGIRAANDLRAKLFAHVVHLPMSFYNITPVGHLMTYMESAAHVNFTINGSFGVIIREPITIVVLVAALIGINPALSLATLLVFPICLIPVVVYGRKARKTHSGVNTKLTNVTTVLHETFTAPRVIKAYNLEGRMISEFRHAIDGIRSYFMKTVRATELPGPLIEFLGAVGVALVFVHFAFFSTGKAPVGQMFAFFTAVFGLYQPVKNLSRLHTQMTHAQVIVKPVYDLLAIPNWLPEPKEPKPLHANGNAIRFENVSFSYGEKPVLKNINLTIKAGQLVALVGRTGSGKTSLVSLLLRFYDPTTGAVLIGDTDIRTVASKDLRANIGVVTQETILFNDTIRANIAVGRPGATNAEIEEAAKHAHADEFIKEKQQGYDCPVGEKGTMVSGGQRQRLAIARAVLKNAPILVLDEALNALDNETERAVQEALEELMQGRTTICIAHRLSTVQNADVIVVLEDGRIVETGTHAELMKAQGVYSKLYEIEFKTAEAVPA